MCTYNSNYVLFRSIICSYMLQFHYYRQQFIQLAWCYKFIFNLYTRYRCIRLSYHASTPVAAVLMPQAPKAEILSSESRVYNSILSVLQGCCLLNLFLQVDPELVVYQSPASIIAVRTDVTDGDGRTGVLTIVLTEFTTYFYFGVRRLTKFYNIEWKSFTALYS